MSMAAFTNKQIESGGILIMMVTILALVTWQFFKGNIDEIVMVTIWASAAPFCIGLYVNTSSPQKAQILSAIWGVFISVVTKKLSIAAAMGELQIIITNAVNMWDQLNQKAKIEASVLTKPSEGAVA